jgi:hypothetical protein
MSDGGRRSPAIPRTEAPTLAGTPDGAQDKRLSIALCRKLIGSESALSDAEVETLRNQMYAIANVALTQHGVTVNNRSTCNTVETIADQIAA